MVDKLKNLCPTVPPRFPREHCRSDLYVGVETLSVLPFRGTLLQRRHVPGVEGEGPTDDPHPVLRRQLRERAEDCWRSAGTLPRQSGQCCVRVYK